MYAFKSSRTAAVVRQCALCGAPLPLPAGEARAAEPLCSTCARPIKLTGVKPFRAFPRVIGEGTASQN